MQTLGGGGGGLELEGGYPPFPSPCVTPCSPSLFLIYGTTKFPYTTLLPSLASRLVLEGTPAHYYSNSMALRNAVTCKMFVN